MNERTLFKRAALIAVLTLQGCGAIGSLSQEEPPATTRAGGELTVGLTPPGDLIPSRATTEPAFLILSTACDGLTALHPETGEPRPALAIRWRFLDDARGLLLTLRPGVKFGDGSAVTPSALKRSLERVASAAGGSAWAHLLARVEGFEAFRQGASQISGIASSGKDLSLSFAEPSSDFLTVLAHPALIPFPEPQEGAAYPSCAGPYRMQAGAGEGDVILMRSDRSRSRSDAFRSMGRGIAERINFRAFGTTDEAFEALRSSSVDLSPVPDNRLTEASSRKGYLKRSTSEITFISMDVSKPQTSNPDVRWALSLGIDRLVIIDAAFGDQRLPAIGWMSERDDPSSVCDQKIRKISDPGKGKELLSAAGVDPATLRLPLVFDQQKVGRLIVQAIQVQLKDSLGIEVQPLPLDAAGLAASMAARFDAALWIQTYRSDLAVPNDLLGGLFATGSSRNTVGFSDASVEGLIGTARKSASQEAGQRAWEQVEDELCRQMVALPLWYGVRHWSASGTVEFKGDSPLDTSGLPVLREAAP